MKNTVIVLSGPSGAGKTTLIKHLLTKRGFSSKLLRIVTCTTRRPRPGERPGKDYVFLGRKEFEKAIREKGFLEWQRILGEYYGTPRQAVEETLRAGKTPLLCIDVQGAKALRRKRGFSFVFVFVLPSQRDWQGALMKRLRGRSAESPGQIKKRLSLAKKEIACAEDYDYVLINDNIVPAVKELGKIITSSIKRKGER
ncbi:MAG: guanylate kinase [Candidatus Omnitrophota bacterium]